MLDLSSLTMKCPLYCLVHKWKDPILPPVWLVGESKPDTKIGALTKPEPIFSNAEMKRKVFISEVDCHCAIEGDKILVVYTEHYGITWYIIKHRLFSESILHSFANKI